jgi:hypothetical protein
MNRTATYLLILGFAILWSGCSTRKPVRVLAAKWNDDAYSFWDDFSWRVGQHLECWYAEENIYCIPATTRKFRGYALDTFVDKEKKPMSRQAVLTELSISIVHFLERNRQFIERHPNIGEVETYTTNFSSSPSDYSLWDCYKTGVGDPALSCTLTAEPDQGQRKLMQPAIDAAKYERDVLLKLSPETLIRACGTPRDVIQDSISRTLVYGSSRTGVTVQLRFDTPDTRLDTVESSESKGADNSYPPEHVFWWADDAENSLAEIPQIKDDLPCLARYPTG